MTPESGPGNPGFAGSEPATPPRWGLKEAFVGLIVAELAAVVGGALILMAAGRTGTDAVEDLPLSLIALLQVPLWLGLLGAPLYAAYRKGDGLRAEFGFRMVPRDIPVGLLWGALAQLVMVPLIYLPLFWLIGREDLSAPARELTDKAQGIGIALLLLVVVVGAPIVEELFFRGLFLRALDRRIAAGWALVVSSAVFGVVHLMPLQFPALMAFGLVAGWLAQRYGRLGPAIWAHVAFNGVAVGLLLAA